MLNLDVISLHRGMQSVKDKSVSTELCQELDLPFGLDGHMYVLGQHIACYKMKELCTCPIDYKGTKEVADLLHTFYSNMSPILLQHFHHEWMAQKMRQLENYCQNIWVVDQLQQRCWIFQSILQIHHTLSHMIWELELWYGFLIATNNITEICISTFLKYKNKWNNCTGMCC